MRVGTFGFTKTRCPNRDKRRGCNETYRSKSCPGRPIGYHRGEDTCSHDAPLKHFGLKSMREPVLIVHHQQAGAPSEECIGDERRQR